VTDRNDEEKEEMNDIEEEDNDEDKLRSWLKRFPGGEGFNSELFADLSKYVLLPIIKQCSVDCTSYCEVQSTERTKAATLLTQSSLNAGEVLSSEACMWMKKIYIRLAGRVTIRRPYHGNISRQIPYGIFRIASLVATTSNDGSFLEPRCYIKKNKKAEVICFTSLTSLQKFMSLLSGLSTREVKKHFSRELKGRCREGHNVKLLVSEDEQFAFTFWINRGQLDISFQYGEWNTCQFPLHNCELDVDML
ncbi:hypothetical protein QZH41_010833, partial [Actinostola sp. cb2023]